MYNNIVRHTVTDIVYIDQSVSMVVCNCCFVHLIGQIEDSVLLPSTKETKLFDAYEYNYFVVICITCLCGGISLLFCFLMNSEHSRSIHV